MPQMQLTSKSVRSAQCPDGEAKVYYFDTNLIGFVLEVRASGGKTFYIRYRNAHGTQKQFKIGGSPPLSVDDARKQAQKLLASIALGEDPANEKKVLRTIPTLKAFVEQRYLPYTKGYKRAWKADDSYLHKHILPKFGDKYLDEITKQDMIDFHYQNKNSHLSLGTANRLMVLFRHVFNMAIEWEVLGPNKNPGTGIPLFEANNARERYLTREEVQHLMVALDKAPNQMLRHIVMMLIMTGARKHEVLEARWENFDLAQRLWRIPMSKSGKARFVPISDGVIELLKSVPRFDGCDIVFPNPKTLKEYSTSLNAWITVRDKAGLPGLRMHDLRHSFASFLINSGRSLYEVQQILGHANIRMTQRYAHLAPSTLLAAANVVPEAAGISFNTSSTVN
jgi:integrase